MEDKLREIMMAVLETSSIGPDASPKTIDNWDSMRQLQLVGALEDEFQFEFDDQEIGRLNSWAGILSVLKARAKA